MSSSRLAQPEILAVPPESPFRVQTGCVSDELQIREYHDGDEPAVLALLQASLGWVPDAQYGRFFVWKHHENPFGRSPAWVAVDGERIVGFRIFLRWEYTRGDATIRAVRAVDTATHPDYQGRGIFSRLTLHAIEALRAEGVAFVFNTPNDSSRPGYLKMNWQPVARLPVLFRPRSIGSLIAVARARVPAEKWSLPTEVGLSAPDVLSDHDGIDELLRVCGTGEGMQTRRTPEFMTWRYGFAPLAYRAMVAGDRLADGLVLFRLRRRGAAVEAAVCDLIVPDARPNAIVRLLRAVLRESRADYCVRIGGAHVARAGSFPLPGQGPILVWREVSDPVMPNPDEWRLVLGDVELF
jgi:GNAT superfamily N-acetyltransferase